MSEASETLGALTALALCGVAGWAIPAFIVSVNSDAAQTKLTKDIGTFAGHEPEVNKLFGVTGKDLVFFEVNGKKCAARIDGDLGKPNYQLMTCAS
jgi:hypothetical protein